MFITEAIEAIEGTSPGWNSLQGVKSGRPNHQQWTVLAALSFSSDSSAEGQEVCVVATGNRTLGLHQLCRPQLSLDRCIRNAHLNGESLRGSPFVLHDLHAEVLALRALRRLYLEAARDLLEQGDSENWCFILDSQGRLEAKPLSWHLSISLPPCGDLTNEARKGLGFNRSTGAKPFHPDCDDCALRYKPGRLTGDLGQEEAVKRCTISLSCTDKIKRWTAMEGAWMGSLLLSTVYPGDIELCGPLPTLTVSYVDESGCYVLENGTPREVNQRPVIPPEYQKQPERSTLGTCMVAMRPSGGSVRCEILNSETGLIRAYTPKRPRFLINTNNDLIVSGGSNPTDACSIFSRLALFDLALTVRKAIEASRNSLATEGSKDLEGEDYGTFKSSSKMAKMHLELKQQVLRDAVVCCATRDTQITKLELCNVKDPTLLPNPRLKYYLKTKLDETLYGFRNERLRLDNRFLADEGHQDKKRKVQHQTV